MVKNELGNKVTSNISDSLDTTAKVAKSNFVIAKSIETLNKNNERAQKQAALSAANLNDLAKKLEGTWGDISAALYKVSDFSKDLGVNFSDIEDLSKLMVANLGNIGSELYEQLDVSNKIKKLQDAQAERQDQVKQKDTEIAELATKKLKDQAEFNNISEKIADAQKRYNEEADKLNLDKAMGLRDKLYQSQKFSIEAAQKAAKEEIAALETDKARNQEAIDYNKNKEEANKSATERLLTEIATNKLTIEALVALEKSAKVLDLAQEHAEKLGFNLDNATNTVSSKLSKSFEFMEEIPFLSDVLGLDAVKEHIEKNVKDSLVKSMMAGNGAASSMFTGMIAGARTLIASLAPMLPLILAAAAAIAVIATIKKAFEFDKELTQFSKDLDVSKDTAMGLSIEADAIAGSLKVAGVNGVEVGKAMATIYDEMGTVAALANKELVGAVSLLQTRIGLTGEEAMALNSTATMLGTTLNELAASSYDMADGLIGGKAMLKEMAKLPKSLVAGFKGTTKELQKAIVKGKLFGITLEQAKKSGESMLDIESSLEKEMTYNVLAGKSLNLNKARQLALTGTQAELQDEIIAQAGSLADYQKMAPLQQKALADAMGMTDDELANMLTKTDEMTKLGLSQVEVEKLMSGTLEEQQAKLAKMGNLEQKAYLQKLVNQKKQEEATAKFADSTAKLGEAFQKVAMPIVEILGEALGLIGELIDHITHAIEGFNEWYHSLTAVVDPITGATEKLKESEGVMHSILKVALGIGGALMLWKVGKSAVSGLKGVADSMKSMMPGASKTPEAPAAPDTSKMDKAKGKGSEGGLTSLAGGLKAMGQSGVGKGILNTALAGPALLLSLPSIPFLAFIGNVKLDKLKENFTGLGNGLKAMDGTLKGSLATGAFGIAGALALASIPFLLVFGKDKLDKLKSNFTSLGTGLQSMSGTLAGAAGLGAFALAGALALASVPFLLVFGKVTFGSLIPNFTSLSTGLQSMSGTLAGAAGLGAFALAGALALASVPFLLVFGKVTFGSLIPNFTGLAEGLMLMSPTLLGSAALAAFGLAAIIAIPSLIFLGGIALLGAVASAGLIALGTGLASLGAVAATGLPFIAVGLIAALGLAMIPFGIALAQSAPGIKAFAEVLGSMGPIIIATFEGIGTVIDKISGGIAMIITTIATSIKSLSDINPLTLMGVAGGIIYVGTAIAGFGAGAGAGGLMAGIGKFFDEDPVDKFNRFAKIDSSKLLEVADSIKQTGISIGTFSSLINAGQLDSVSIAIDKLAESLSNFGAGGLMSSITSFFDEDPVDKFNRFASIDGNKLLLVSNSIRSLGETIGSFGTAINIDQLDSVGEAIDRIGTSILDFGAKAGGGGMMAGIASFFDEDPVEKFNRFATIDSGKLLEVASAIDKLGNAFRNFSTSVSNIGDTSGITNTIDKVMELQDSIVSSPMENIVDSVSSAVDSVFAKASEFVSSIMPEDISTSMTPVQPTSDVQAVQTVTPAPAVIEKQPIVATTTQQTAAPAAQGSLTEVAGLLKQLIAATSQPVKINIGGRVIDEIEKQTTLRKTYNTKVDSGYGTHG